MENIKRFSYYWKWSRRTFSGKYMQSRAMIDQVVMEKEMFSGGQIVTTDKN